MYLAHQATHWPLGPPPAGKHSVSLLRCLTLDLAYREHRLKLCCFPPALLQIHVVAVSLEGLLSHRVLDAVSGSLT